MRQWTLLFLLTYMLLIVGCETSGSGSETTSTDSGKTPSPTQPVSGTQPSQTPGQTQTPAPSPSPSPSHSGEYLVGKWVDQTDSTQVWFFYSDGTGFNQKCNHTFNWPKEVNWTTQYVFQISDIQPALLINGCKPLTGNYPLSRNCSILKYNANAMRFECNFQGQNHDFLKVQ